MNEDNKFKTAPPPTVPNFKIEREIGSGGYGIVYEATEISNLELPTAIKVPGSWFYVGVRLVSSVVGEGRNYCVVHQSNPVDYPDSNHGRNEAYFKGPIGVYFY